MSVTEKKIRHISDIEMSPVFVEFYGPNCSFCRAIEPVIENLSEEFPDIAFIKVNTDECPEAAKIFGLKGLPTFVLLKEGKEVGRLLGAKKAPVIRELLEKLYVL